MAEQGRANWEHSKADTAKFIDFEVAPKSITHSWAHQSTDVAWDMGVTGRARPVPGMGGANREVLTLRPCPKAEYPMLGS